MHKKKEGIRPVRIYLAMEERSILRYVIEQVFGTVHHQKSHLFVKTEEEADLVVFEDAQRVKLNQNRDSWENFPERVYVLLNRCDCETKVPNNLSEVLSAVNLMDELKSLIQKVWLSLKPLA